jgi:hypothetical protein
MVFKDTHFLNQKKILLQPASVHLFINAMSLFQKSEKRIRSSGHLKTNISRFALALLA